jgi:hypothetical protein
MSYHPNCSHVLFLLLKFHHYIHKFFEVLWLLDGALERNVFEIVMYGNLLAQLHLVQDLMYATMYMVGFKKGVMRIVNTTKNKRDSHRYFRVAFNDIVQVGDFKFNNMARIMIASLEENNLTLCM